MENYVKVILYAYPLLETVGKDYEEHIKNKALLSYESSTTTERLAESIAGEILCMDKLEWLKATVDGVLDELDEVERTLLAIRYFGKRKGIRKFLPLRRVGNTQGVASGWSEGKYRRKQQKLGEKTALMLKNAGITKAVYERDFLDVDIFRKIHNFVEKGKDKKISASERQWREGRVSE